MIAWLFEYIQLKMIEKFFINAIKIIVKLNYQNEQMIFQFKASALELLEPKKIANQRLT